MMIVSSGLAAIVLALIYAQTINAPNVHVMAGIANGPKAHQTFVTALKYACTQAATRGVTILIEPLNKYHAPGYFLTTPNQAHEVIAAVDAPNLKLMFDCYHVQLMERDQTNRLKSLLPMIGHIQFASVPDRGAPDHDGASYAHVSETITALGYTTPLGAEYKPTQPTDQTLAWLKHNQIKATP